MIRNLTFKQLSKKWTCFEDKILELISKEELKVYKKLSKEKQLDQIKKKKLSFPQDVYPKDNCPLEWWYFTGHLEAESKKEKKNKLNEQKDKVKREFGFEFCIFKFNTLAIRITALPLNYFKKGNMFVNHFAISDKTNKKFNYKEGESKDNKYDEKSINIELDQSSIHYDEKNKTFHISANSEFGKIKLKLTPTKIVKHFDNGYIEMYKKPSHRTYYISSTRLNTEGTLSLNNENFQVKGESWFDHQKLNLVHNSPLQGWDWFSVMFDDNTELMLFTLRNKRGLTHQHMGGSYIKKDGKKINIKPKDIKVRVLSTWISPKTRIKYPAAWQLISKKLKLDITIRPEFNQQEIYDLKKTPITYWEGACKVTGTKNNKQVTGKSYVELVGYDQRLITKIIQKNLA